MFFQGFVVLKNRRRRRRGSHMCFSSFFFLNIFLKGGVPIKGCFLLNRLVFLMMCSLEVFLLGERVEGWPRLFWVKVSRVLPLLTFNKDKNPA